MISAFRRRVGRDLAATALRRATDCGMLTRVPHGPVVTQDDLLGLPMLARRYLIGMEVVGRHRDSVVSIDTHGRFRLRPNLPWLPYVAHQINTAAPIGRMFHMRIDATPLVPLVAEDAYVAGRGWMRGRAFGLLGIVDASGPELDSGELVTWLNDAVLLAPTMLLHPWIEWSDLDDHSFGVTVRDGARSATARVVLDDAGRVSTFETFDRSVDLGGGMQRARWSTPVSGWSIGADGRPTFSSGSAVWELPDGDFEYARAHVSPGDAHAGV